MGNCLSICLTMRLLFKKKDKKYIPGNVVCCCNKSCEVEVIYDEIRTKDIII